MGYSASVKFKDRRGCETIISIRGCKTQGDAIQKIWDWAFEDGYTVPQWWQFWRWNDQRPPAGFVYRSALSAELIKEVA